MRFQWISLAISIFFDFLLMNGCSLQPQTCIQKYIKEDGFFRFKFYLIRSCSRSKMAIVAKANLSLQRCVSLAQQKRAFAINVAPVHLTNINLSETCQILACPEYESMMSLEKNTNFDYYSTYADPMPPNNYKCIPKVGLFRVEASPRSWRSSRLACLDEDSDLAQITSAAQAEAVYKMLEDELSRVIIHNINIQERIWVGMQRSNSLAPFVTVTGKSLSCYRYRAWAPYEPRRGQKNCVAMNSTLWYTLRCNSKYSSICELRANGPSLISGPGHWNFPSGRCPAQIAPRN